MCVIGETSFWLALSHWSAIVVGRAHEVESTLL